MRGKHREGGRTCSPRRRSLHSDEPLRRNGRKTPAAKSIFIERPTCSAREKRPSGRGVRFCTRGMGWGGELSDFLPFQLSLDSLCCARATGTYTNHSPTLVRVEHDPLQRRRRSCTPANVPQGSVGEVAVSGAVVGYGIARTTQPTPPGPFPVWGAGEVGKRRGVHTLHFSPGGTFRTPVGVVRPRGGADTRIRESSQRRLLAQPFGTYA